MITLLYVCNSNVSYLPQPFIRLLVILSSQFANSNRERIVLKCVALEMCRIGSMSRQECAVEAIYFDDGNHNAVTDWRVLWSKSLHMIRPASSFQWTPSCDLSRVLQ